jgi:uncharacterized protein YjbI with pentapeptide repeats
MVARLRGRILVLSLIALLFLALAVQAEPSRVVPAEEILKKIELGQAVEYDNVTIVGDMDVSTLNLPRMPVGRTRIEYYMGLTDYEAVVASPIKITHSVIKGSVDLIETAFKNAIIFHGTRFEGTAFLIGSRFNDTANFWSTRFNQDADFENAKFNQDADFSNAKFNQDADFSNAKFNQHADFSDAKFNQYADFSDAKFNRTDFRNARFNRTDFQSAQFNQYAVFEKVQFNQDASFWNARFNQTAGFLKTQFNQDADFSNARFNQTAGFLITQFNQDAYFENAKFNQIAEFGYARFNHTAGFWDTRFNQIAEFGYAQFNQTANFGYAQFNQDAHFEDANFLGLSFDNCLFSKDPFFDDAKINGTLSLYRTKYDKLNIRWSSIHDLAYDDTAYYLLIENFKKLGFTDDASECYYSYRCKHREELFRQGKIDSWFFDLLAWMTNGYGLRPVRPLGWSVLFILLGGAFFFVTKSISRSKGPEPSGNRRRTIRGKELPQKASEVSIWEALLLSATYFTSGASSIISSVPEEFSPLGRSRYVVVILRLLGWIFFVLFLTSLGKIA